MPKTVTPVTDLVNRMTWDTVNHQPGLSEHDHQLVDAFVAQLAGMSDAQVAAQWGYTKPANICDLRTLFHSSWREVAR